MKKLALIAALYGMGCGPCYKLDAPVTILNYHGIEEVASNKYTRSTSDFIHDLDYFQSQYQFMTIETLHEKIKKQEPIGRATIILNFDDGLSEHYTIAFKELLKRSIPADFFVPTARVGSLNGVTWDELIEMHKAGYSIQSHSYDHIPLADKVEGETQSAYEARIHFELSQSMKDLQSHGMDATILATPFGSQNDTVIQIAYDVGFNVVRGTGSAVETMFPETAVVNLDYEDVYDDTTIELIGSNQYVPKIGSIN